MKPLDASILADRRFDQTGRRYTPRGRNIGLCDQVTLARRVDLRFSAAPLMDVGIAFRDTVDSVAIGTTDPTNSNALFATDAGVAAARGWQESIKSSLPACAPFIAARTRVDRMNPDFPRL